MKAKDIRKLKFPDAASMTSFALIEIAAQLADLNAFERFAAGLDTSLDTELDDEDRDDEPRRCRVCGCTDDACSQCIEKTGKPCFWVGADLCSACQDSTDCNGPGSCIVAAFNGLFVLVNPTDPNYAWSGSRWVDHVRGVGEHVHVSNFETADEACRYASTRGFTVAGRPA